MTEPTVKDDGHRISWIYSAPDVSRNIFDVVDSDDKTIAVMKWVGDEVYQPCIEAKEDLRVLYDGASVGRFGHENISNPCTGKELLYEKDKTYYFKNLSMFNTPDMFNSMYNLSQNNASLRFNNISLFHKDKNVGVVMDFRASFQNDDCVIVLASRLKISMPATT